MGPGRMILIIYLTKSVLTLQLVRKNINLYRLQRRDSLPVTGGVTCRLHQTRRKFKISPGILDQSQQRRSPMALWSLRGHNLPKKPPKMSVLRWNSSKNSNFRISEFYFSDFSKKKKTKQVSTRLMPTKPDQNSMKLRWDDRSIWRRRPTTTSPSSSSTSSSPKSTTPMATTSGTPDNIITIRNIMANSTPSWQYFWSRPLMANIGKSTTLAMWETTPHWLQVATRYWGWVGDGKADETFNPWVVGRHTSTTGQIYWTLLQRRTGREYQ